MLGETLVCGSVIFFFVVIATTTRTSESTGDGLVTRLVTKIPLKDTYSREALGLPIRSKRMRDYAGDC